MTSALEVRGLHVRFEGRGGTAHAVRGLSLALAPGEAAALVGESGCGKTVTALALLGLVPRPGRVEAAEVRLAGRSLEGLTEEGWSRVRGRELAMVFQDPMTSLNPVLTVGRQLTDPLRHHLGLGKEEARARAVELLRMVGIPDPGERLDDHPHRFSGGQRQRVLLALALSCGPSVLIADEPTTALDVTVQAQIADLLAELRERLGMALLWITHDLALVSGRVDRVMVMYAGAVVESARALELFRHPRHPYTRGLLASLPSPDRGGRLTPIAGRPPDPRTPPRGCAFAPRCAWAEEACRGAEPPLEEAAPGHAVACLRWAELGTSAGVAAREPA